MARDADAAGDDRSRQKRVGEALRDGTRRRILAAAGEEFAAQGYRAATVAKLAAAAGVSVQTLYLTWGSKRALLRAWTETAIAGDAGVPADAAARFGGGLAAGERIDLIADIVTEVAARAASAWAVYRDAAGVDPEIAEDWNDLQHRRHGLFTRLVGTLTESDLAVGLSSAAAVDTAWTIASPETYDLLVRRRGYSLDEFREWLSRTLRAALLPPDPMER
ncbi:MAG: TetR family transcriptional regulator [Microbacterium sp.]|jgi:AcrR family transcriptional regulator|uniref:TetR/AcrR family transcriptional regulator n=1 Tax=Microbacterium sp. TaxID=51671 RepID=UPI0025CE0B37|nr:TetR/AcrR family transcriptional regulator [Microbacterium sp.]MBQ9916876.1 TetR family transcriptional regulator [Microbacterium sp.]